jgi:hypothetical protein
VLLPTNFRSRGDPNVRGTLGVRLRGPRQNSHFWSILTSFLCYYPLILGPGAIRTFGQPCCPVTETSSKLVDLVPYSQFSVLLPTNFRSRGDPNVRGTLGVRLRGPRQNSHIWSILTSFLCYYPLSLGPGVIRTFGEPQGSGYEDLVKTRIFGPFWQFSVGLGAIRMFGEPRGPVTGTSSKLAYLVHSDQFSMLLLTDFGSRGDPNVRGTPGSGYGDIVKTSIFRPFITEYCAIIN